jgi:hypothetical protein
MQTVRHRTPLGLATRLEQRSNAQLARAFGVTSVPHRQRRSCRCSKTETITRAPPEDQQQQQQQESRQGQNNEWQAQENLVSLITALPIPSPQEMLDNSASQQLQKPWEEETPKQWEEETPKQPEKRVQAPGNSLNRSDTGYIPATRASSYAPMERGI